MCSSSLRCEQAAGLVPPLRLDVQPRERGRFRVAFVERRVVADRNLAPRRLHPQRGFLPVVREHAAADRDEAVHACFLQPLLHPVERPRVLAGGVLHQHAISLAAHDAPGQGFCDERSAPSSATSSCSRYSSGSAGSAYSPLSHQRWSRTSYPTEVEWKYTERNMW